MTGIGQSFHRGPGAEPRIKRSGEAPPEAEKLLLLECSKKRQIHPVLGSFCARFLKEYN